MALVKCDYCRERVRPRLKALHEKKCVYARRARKAELAHADNPLRCDKCEFTAKTLAGLGAHKRKHTEKPE